MASIRGRLAAIAEQLRLYKPPASDVDDEEEESPVGNQPSERFRPKRAAVLICLSEDSNGGLRVILTKRSSRLSTHSGEVSLPGGKAEEDDVDDADTATREAKEEIGLDPSLVNVVALLEPFLSKHLLQVIPVIGILGDRSAFNPTPNVAEVDDVFDAPLEMFLKVVLLIIHSTCARCMKLKEKCICDQDENRRCEEREWMGDRYTIHYFDYEMEDGKKYVIWGLTAGVLIQAASLVYQRQPAFLQNNPKFKIPRYSNSHTLMH